jgi:hypothetical protein
MPSWKDLKRFCENDDWELIQKKNPDHYYYQKKNDDGTRRFTKISKGTGEIKGHLWDEILKKQLQVSKEYFNSKI